MTTFLHRAILLCLIALLLILTLRASWFFLGGVLLGSLDWHSDTNHYGGTTTQKCKHVAKEFRAGQRKMLHKKRRKESERRRDFSRKQWAAPTEKESTQPLQSKRFRGDFRPLKSWKEISAITSWVSCLLTCLNVILFSMLTERNAKNYFIDISEYNQYNFLLYYIELLILYRIHFYYNILQISSHHIIFPISLLLSEFLSEAWKLVVVIPRILEDQLHLYLLVPIRSPWAGSSF